MPEIRALRIRVTVLRTVLDLPGESVTGTPSISLISNFIIYRWTMYVHWGLKDTIWGPGLKRATISAHFQWNRWRTCYLFNKIDGVPVTSSTDGSRTEEELVESRFNRLILELKHGFSWLPELHSVNWGLPGSFKELFLLLLILNPDQLLIGEGTM